MRKLLTALLACAVPGCASQPQSSVDAASQPQPTLLTHEELKALMSDTRTVLFSGFGLRGTGIFQSDGTARLNHHGGWTSFGSWKIEGNRLCTSYVRSGPGCYHLEKTGAATYRLILIDGRESAVWEFVK